MLFYVQAGQRSAALAQYETCSRLLADELGIEPETATTHLYQQIKSEQIAIPVAPTEPKLHLPAMATPFIERPRDLARHRRATAPTRLPPIDAGRRGWHRQNPLGGACRCRDLPKIIAMGCILSGWPPHSRANFCQSRLPTACISRSKGGDPRSELIDYLARRELLLVLDNFEHLVDYAGLITDILSHAAHVRILVTSRVWLNLHEEWMLVIDGMDVPSVTLSDAEQYSAVQLFDACARRAQADFSLNDQLEAVVKICQMVEGMPSEHRIGGGVAARHPTNGNRPQHRMSSFWRQIFATCRNGIAVSKRYLNIRGICCPPATADVLTKLAVFKGVFDREAAEQVAGASVSILASLLEHSLIRRVDETYYTMHELLRQFAFERLSDR